MYIRKATKKKDLPDGKFIVTCDNYCDKKQYWLIDRVLARKTVFNSKYDLRHNKTTTSSFEKDGLYVCNEIKEDRYKLYNV